MTPHPNMGSLPVRVFLTLVSTLVLSACGALQGISPGGSPSGVGTILSPGEPVSATGERDSSTVDKGDGLSKEVGDGGLNDLGDGGGAQVPMPAMGNPKSPPPGDTAFNDPHPGGYPAPSHDPDPGDDPLADEDCETYAAALDGIGTLCRKQGGGLLMKVDAFLRQCSGDKVLEETYNNAYTLLIKNTATHKTVEFPLTDGTLTTTEGPVVKSGHVFAVADFSTRPYPSCIGDLDFFVISNQGRSSPRVSPIFVLKGGKVLPTSVLASLPYDISDLPACPTLSEMYQKIMHVVPMN